MCMHGPAGRYHFSSGAAASIASSRLLGELNGNLLQEREQCERFGNVFTGHLYQCEQQRVPLSRRRLRRAGGGGSPASGVRLRNGGRFAEAMMHDPAADAGPELVQASVQDGALLLAPVQLHRMPQTSPMQTWRCSGTGQLIVQP